MTYQSQQYLRVKPPTDPASNPPKINYFPFCIIIQYLNGHIVDRLRGPRLAHHPLHLLSIPQRLHRRPLPSGSHFLLDLFPSICTILTLLLVSYYRAVFASPGYTDPLDNSKYSQEQFAVFRQNAIKQKTRRQLRKSARYGSDPTQITELKETSYCSRCEAVKPPRAHHCRVCEKCILRMDHHCPWVGNCVGVKNHKFFMLFLLYATLGLTMTWVTLCIDAFQDWKLVSSFYEEDAARYMMVAVTIASILLSLSIGSLLIGQIIGLGQNLTTLETFIPNITQHLPFDNGSWQENAAEIFGQKYWLLPIEPYYETSV